MTIVMVAFCARTINFGKVIGLTPDQSFGSKTGRAEHHSSHSEIMSRLRWVLVYL